MGPSFAHGQMRLYLLSLLGEQPMHGYELMQAIEQRFNGAYVPSAGTIYPRLAKLTEEGKVTKETRGRKTVYRITDEGRAELAQRSDELKELDGLIADSVRSMADDLRRDFRRSMSDLKADLQSSASVGPRSGAGASSNPFESSADRRGAAESADARESEPLRQAERLVYHFGLDVRDTLRSADAAVGLSEQSVERVGAELERALNAIQSIVVG